MSLFLNVKYHLASSLPPDRQSQISHVLDSNGATVAESVTDATHIITDSIKFEGWREVTTAAIVTVRVQRRVSFYILLKTPLG